MNPKIVGVSILALLLTNIAKAQQRSSAQSSERTSTASSKGSGQIPTLQVVADSSTYLIGPEDVLDISVWKEPDFSRLVPVRPDGRISLPLLADIQAAGLTPVQLAAYITEKLRKFVTQPQVTVIVTQINSKRVFILGEVTRPGPVGLLPTMTVLQALAVAGGITQFANAKGIYVLREENGKQVRYPFNYKEVIRGESLKQNILLKPGDTIVVP